MATNSNSKNARSRIVASLRGSLGTRTKEGESSTGRVWAAGFHHVNGPFSLGARFENYEPFIYLIFQIFFGPRIRGSACTVFFRDVRSAKIIFNCYVADKLNA